MSRLNQSQKKAIDITIRVLSQLGISEGRTEKQVADQIKLILKKLRAKPAFRIIVASGKRSAIPHGFATRKRIKRGELVVIDFGALYNGYRTDITRTVTTRKATERQKKILRIVKEAQRRAIKKVRVGVPCCEVDRAARAYIENKGFGKYFVHSTGHRIGRKTHEAPKISKGNRKMLKAGMVICIEPGIYIKGWGGVRIEDMVLVTQKGCKLLTR
jgi:Xaa-Pro aminopeptidase